MIVDDNLIAKLAKLSSLEIDDSRKEKLKSRIRDIINFVENLNDIDVNHWSNKELQLKEELHSREDVSKQDLELKTIF